jgi:hypothetical protein
VINNKEIAKFDLKNVSIDEIEQFISKSILGHSRPTMEIATTFFRARIINDSKEEDLQTVKCIYYPDWSEINPKQYRFGRCNDKGQNFFYASNYLGTTIKELNPKHNDLVLIGVFEKKHEDIKIPCQFAGIETLKLNSHRNSLIKDYVYANNSDVLTEEFMASKFKEKILPQNDFQYKLTIAFTNILLKNDNIGGLIYPSVASEFEYANYGIKVNYVDHLLYCKSIYMYRIKKSDTEYKLIPEKYGVNIMHNPSINKASIIEWKVNSEEEKERVIKYRI